MFTWSYFAYNSKNMGQCGSDTLMSRLGRPCVVGIYMHLESKLESQKALAESNNTRETLPELEKQYA